MERERSFFLELKRERSLYRREIGKRYTRHLTDSLTLLRPSPILSTIRPRRRLRYPTLDAAHRSSARLTKRPPGYFPDTRLPPPRQGRPNGSGRASPDGRGVHALPRASKAASSLVAVDGGRSKPTPTSGHSILPLLRPLSYIRVLLPLLLCSRPFLALSFRPGVVHGRNPRGGRISKTTWT